MSGESVDEYVRRAVAARLSWDLEHSGDPADAPLLQLLEEMRGGTRINAMSIRHPALADPARLQALRSTGLLDSEPDPSYDRIVSAAAEALGVSNAAISLIDEDRQFFKSALGLDADVRETPCPAPCASTPSSPPSRWSSRTPESTHC